EVARRLDQVGRHLDDLGAGAGELLVTGADAVHVHEAERAREAAREPHDDVEPATEGSEIDHGALDGGQREERRALADPETRRHRSHRFTLTQSPGAPAMA